MTTEANNDLDCPCCGGQHGYVLDLLAELAAARAERSAELKSLSDKFAVLLAEREWLREQNDKLTTMHAERTVERDTLRAREQRMREALTKAAPYSCAECGDHVKVDEDGCCAMCGGDAALAEEEDRLCVSCQCRHPKDVMCPPHEMRYSAEDK